MIVQAKKVQPEAKRKEIMAQERVIGATEEKESKAKERVIGAKEGKEIGAKEEQDSAVNQEQSKERARVKERREARAHMNSRMALSRIVGDNNQNFLRS